MWNLYHSVKSLHLHLNKLSRISGLGPATPSSLVLWEESELLCPLWTLSFLIFVETAIRTGRNWLKISSLRFEHQLLHLENVWKEATVSTLWTPDYSSWMTTIAQKQRITPCPMLWVPKVSVFYWLSVCGWHPFAITVIVFSVTSKISVSKLVNIWLSKGFYYQLL